MRIKINGKEYFQISKIMYSGTLESSSRRLEIEYLDYYKSKSNIKVDTGDNVELLNDDNEVLFTGMVYNVKNNTNSTTSNLTAFDNGIRLSKNYLVKNYSKQTPSQITKKVLGEIGVKLGKLPIDKVKCSFPAIEKTAYDIILSAYTIQHNKDKVIYSIVCDETGGIEVKPQGEVIEDLVLTRFYDETNFEKDISNIINQIVVYETKDNKINTIDKAQDSESISKYGVFQDVMRKDKSTQNIYDAKSMLETQKEKLSVRVKGDSRLKSGLSVAFKDNISKIYGQFYIRTDNHVWTSNEYYTDLTFEFENVMEKIEIERIEEKKKKVDKWDWLKKYGGDQN